MVFSVTLSKGITVFLQVTKYGKVSWIFYERLSVRSINSSLPLPNKYFSQILNVARCTKIEKRFWLVCIMHVLATFNFACNHSQLLCMLLLVVFNSNRFSRSNTILNVTKIWDTWKQVQQSEIYSNRSFKTRDSFMPLFFVSIKLCFIEIF